MAEVVALPSHADHTDIEAAWQAIVLCLADKGLEAPTAEDPGELKRLVAEHGLWDDLTFRGLMETLTLTVMRSTAEGRAMLRDRARELQLRAAAEGNPVAH